jgi:lipopolysaccharide transport periplasmic protein LptA
MNLNNNVRFSMMARQPLGSYLFLLLCTFWLPTAAHALPSDKEQPIHISANSAQLDRKQRTATYTGDVKLKQGTLEISADRITIHTNNNDKVEKMEAHGSPARYQQKPAENQATITAQANSIRYTLTNEHLLLLENAFLEQENGASISGNRIDYDIRKEIMKAAGKKDAQQPQRIEIVIPPQTINQD